MLAVRAYGTHTPLAYSMTAVLCVYCGLLTGIETVIRRLIIVKVLRRAAGLLPFVTSQTGIDVLRRIYSYQ